MAACNNSSDDKIGNEPQSITLVVKAAIPSSNGTRAEVAPMPDPFTSVIEDAYIYVVDYQGKVLVKSGLTAAEASAGKAITTTTAAYDVLVVANYPASFTAPTYTTRSEIESAAMNMSALDIAAPVAGNEHGSKFAMMYNVQATTIPASGDPRPVTVTIAPVVARMEIAQVAGDMTTADPGSPVATFTLAGVYMNNVYQSLTLANGITAGGGKLSGSDLTTRPAWSFDAYTNEYGGALTYAATGGVWAYHFAPVSDPNDVPGVILHLKDVVYGDASTAPADLYVAVKKYVDGSDAPVTEFKRNHVYKISKLEFNHTHLSVTPQPTDINLTATVTVQGWTFVPITPEF
jgi:hypothetical protein